MAKRQAPYLDASVLKYDLVLGGIYAVEKNFEVKVGTERL